MKVLVVDDDPVGLLLAATVVETLGHVVETASSGLDGLSRIERKPFPTGTASAMTQ